VPERVAYVIGMEEWKGTCAERSADLRLQHMSIRWRQVQRPFA
jgi:hypothetical protein